MPPLPPPGSSLLIQRAFRVSQPMVDQAGPSRGALGSCCLSRTFLSWSLPNRERNPLSRQQRCDLLTRLRVPGVARKSAEDHTAVLALHQIIRVGSIEGGGRRTPAPQAPARRSRSAS